MKRSWRVALVTAVTLIGIPAVVTGGAWLYYTSDVISYQSIDGGALVSASGRTISVTAAALCDQSVALTADQAEATVSIKLRYAQPRTETCSGMPGFAVYRIRLDQPLGQRRLVDGVTGKPVPHLDAEAIRRPAYVPPGYAFRYDAPGAAVFPGFQYSPLLSHSGVSYSELFTTSDGDELVVTQQPAEPGSRPTRTGLRMTAVNGHRAQTATGVLTWTEHGVRFTVTTNPPLPRTELLAVASSIPS